MRDISKSSVVCRAVLTVLLSLLLGDSITQFSTLTFQAYLQTQYIRRLDVINRGLSGFTAPMGFRALKKFLPSIGESCAWPQIKLATVFFGANDACVPGNQQHVELSAYVDTLKSIVHYPTFQQPGVQKTTVILITPPPVNEHQFEQAPHGPFPRRAGVTSQYARAAVEMCRAYGVPVLDFWSIIMQKVGWNPSMGRDCCSQHLSYQLDLKPVSRQEEVRHIPGCHNILPTLPNTKYQLSDFLTDGLHLTKLGYDVLFLELMKIIRKVAPECAPQNLPFILPEWRNALAGMEDGL